MDNITYINEMLENYAKAVPVNGTHINYLVNAGKLIELYKESLSITDEEQTPENEQKLQQIVDKMHMLLQ